MCPLYSWNGTLLALEINESLPVSSLMGRSSKFVSWIFCISSSNDDLWLVSYAKSIYCRNQVKDNDKQVLFMPFV